MPVNIGIDVGGTSIKGAVVDHDSGRIVSERIQIETPAGAEPEGICDAVVGIVERLGRRAHGSIGICVPAVVQRGVTQTSANISDRWLSLDAQRMFSSALGKDVTLLNDADAAGLAEARFGAAQGIPGLVLVTTLGTGVGVAMLHDGVLIPNSELGHLTIDGQDWEQYTAASALQRHRLTWPEWAANLQRYYTELESLLRPDLFIVGGGIADLHTNFLPLLRLRAPIVPARLREDAGIVGAAAHALGRSRALPAEPLRTLA